MKKVINDEIDNTTVSIKECTIKYHYISIRNDAICLLVNNSYCGSDGYYKWSVLYSKVDPVDYRMGNAYSYNNLSFNGIIHKHMSYGNEIFAFNTISEALMFAAREIDKLNNT